MREGGREYVSPPVSRKVPRATSLTLLLTCWHAYYLLTYLPPQGRQARRTRGQPELLGRRPRAVLGTLPEVCGGGARLRASSEVACLESPTGQLFEWVEALFVNVIVCGLSYGCGRSEIAKRSAFVIIGIPQSFTWPYTFVIGEAVHDHHHLFPALAHRPGGVDFPYFCFIRPLEMLGLIWNVKHMHERHRWDAGAKG